MIAEKAAIRRDRCSPLEMDGQEESEPKVTFQVGGLGVRTIRARKPWPDYSYVPCFSSTHSHISSK